MKLLQAGHDQLFMTWQYKVQAANFCEYGLEQEMIILVAIKEGKPSDHILEFQKEFKGKIYFYEDTRNSKVYMPSIRPHLISKYLKNNPLDVFFYHDQDIIFIDNPKLDDYKDDPYHYVAPKAKGYTYPTYLKSFKGGDLFKKMCLLSDINPTFVEENEDNFGGAQYIIRNTDYKFWERFEWDLEEMYKFLREYVSEDIQTGTYHIQIWAADLYQLMFSLLKSGTPVRPLSTIDFAWPFQTFEEAKAENQKIMHNAGISESNRNHWETVELLRDGELKQVQQDSYRPRYFDKGLYNDVHGHPRVPFNDDFSFIDKDLLQTKYVEYFKIFKTKPNQMSERRLKILAIWNTTYGRQERKIHPELVAKSLETLKTARDNAKIAEVTVVTTTWSPIPNNPFTEYLAAFKNFGHMSYIMAMQQCLVNNPGYDVIVIIEHDCLTNPNYFDEINQNWDYGKYFLSNRNYSGINKTGFIDRNPREHHHPMSQMAFATRFFTDLLNTKIAECIKNIAPGSPYGWACVEPDDKGQGAEYYSKIPNLHVSTSGLGEYEHHLTIHDQVCYEHDSNGKTYRSDWGNYTDLLPFLKQYQ